MHTTRIALAIAASAAALSTAPVHAQSILLPSGPEKGVALEAAYTDFKTLDVAVPSSTWFLSGRMPIGPRFRIVGDVPFAYGNVDFGAAESTRDAVIGNPRLGAEYLIRPSLALEASFRLPVTSASESSVADVLAFLADPQRGEAFARDVVPVTAALHYERGLEGGFGLRARAGGTTIFFTDDDAAENVTFLDYGLFGSYTTGPARFGAGFSGRWDASEEEGDFADNSMHWLGLTADAAVRGVRPGLSFRLPLDKDYREFVGPTVGLYLHVPVR